MNRGLLVALGILLVLGVFLGNRVRHSQKHFDHTVNYSPRTFKPYDTRFFFLSLKKHTQLLRNTRAPGGKRFTGTGSTYVVCSPYFLPDEAEKNEILRFVADGNRLLLSSFEIAPHFLKTLDITGRSLKKPSQATGDSLKIVWKTGETWSYPGSAAAPGLIPSLQHSRILALDGRGFPSLIRMPYGEGGIWIQLQPMAFSCCHGSCRTEGLRAGLSRRTSTSFADVECRSRHTGFITTQPYDAGAGS
ncbi:MAG: DUF4350 domain-containing protein [Leadbetterella sp.]|nr:DUF4350 domain-containing protein [Leadbetterella sp.]